MHAALHMPLLFWFLFCNSDQAQLDVSNLGRYIAAYTGSIDTKGYPRVREDDALGTAEHLFDICAGNGGSGFGLDFRYWRLEGSEQASL